MTETVLHPRSHQGAITHKVCSCTAQWSLTNSQFLNARMAHYCLFWLFFGSKAHCIALLCAAQALVLARHVDVGGGEVPELWKQPWFADTRL